MSSETNARTSNLEASDTASGGHRKEILDKEKDVETPNATINSRQPPSSHAVTFPDGGLTAWLSILGVWLTFFATFGYLTSFGVYQDYYTRIYLNNKTPSDISWIGSVQAFLNFVGGLPSGVLMDLGYFRQLFTIGGLVYTFSQFMLSLAKPDQYYQVFLSQAIGVGLGLGLLFVPVVNIPMHHFLKRRLIANGVATTGTSVGGVIWPIMLNKLFNNPSVGFAWGVRYSSFILVGLLVVANFLMKTRLPNRRQREAAGIIMPKPSLKALLSDAPYLLTVAGATFIGFGLFFPLFYIQLFAVKHGISTSLSFYSLAIMNASTVLGRTVPSLVADKYGAFNVYIPCCFITGGVIFAMFGSAKSAGSLVGFCIVYGFFSGPYFSLIAPLVSTFARAPSEIGLRIGLAYFFGSIAFLFGTPIAGALLTSEYHWWRPILFSGICTFGGTGLLTISRQIMSKRKGTQIL